MSAPNQPNPSWQDLRRYLAERRRDLGITQADLARAMGTTQSAVSELETGHTADPGLNTVARWAAALNTQIVIEAEVVVRQRFAIAPRAAAEPIADAP
jgi:transcriptional regulator with XRE-family HTH domain